MGDNINFSKRVKKFGTTMSESKCSNLLSLEENETVFHLLGPRCQSLATTVIQLYITIGAEHNEWYKKDTGVLCLVKDNLRRSYFFRLYCPSRQQLVWEHEVYNSMEYNAPQNYLHTFEAEDYIAAFSFVSEEEAAWLRSILLAKLETKKQRRERKSQRLNQRDLPGIPSYSTSNGIITSQQQILTNSQLSNRVNNNKGIKKKKDKSKKLSKADIGTPKNFRHISHVGWDADKGFEYDLANNDDPSLQSFLHKAGVSEKHMQDRETRDFIYDFIEKNGGLEAVKQEEPPVSRSVSTANRAAPPPPPPRIGAFPASLQSPPPLPPLRTIPQRNHEGLNAVVPPPPEASFPPPPPPPPLPGPKFDLNPAPLPTPTPSVLPGITDVRSQLMESIRSGASLKHVEVDSKNKQDSRGELLDQIRQGVELKSVQPIVRSNEVKEKMGSGLAGALARALAERSKVIHSESSTSSDDDDDDGDDEWED
uniref:WH1 domain-containing protein n=2 Tax=Clastoptera arizonana TaxID=38151 RepID=A0A1B6CW90_9HEMI